MFYLVQIIVPVCVVVVLPVLIVWLVTRTSINRNNKNAEILIKAIESGNNIDTDRLAQALEKKQKTPMELLRLRLLRGCIFTFVGIASAVLGILIDEDFSIIGLIFLGIGLAYLVVYFTTRKEVKAETAKEQEPETIQ